MSILAIIIGYLIGSIPFAWLLARRWGADDLRQIGSGNIGAANVVRAAGLAPGLIVATLDIAKGAASVWLAGRLTVSVPASAAAGVAAIVGHVYPVWLRYRGGKGVATACGVFTLLAPAAVVPAFALFVAGVWLTRYISVGSVLACLALPPIAFAEGSPAPVVAAASFAAALIVFRHRSNLTRVRLGTERRLGARV
jgi:glycerol-3-phosphate acyltransferase PlsY